MSIQDARGDAMDTKRTQLIVIDEFKHLRIHHR